jgi:hypothetical protein
MYKYYKNGVNCKYSAFVSRKQLIAAAEWLTLAPSIIELTHLGD